MTAVAFEVYTDGCCLENPGGPGGWAAVVIPLRGEPWNVVGGDPSTTNNRMELCAAIGGLNALASSRVSLVTDSRYVMDGFVSWMPNWKRKGWVTKAKQPVLNRDLWEALDAAVARHIAVRWSWQRGHAGHRWNELADELALAAAEEQEGPPDLDDPEEAFEHFVERLR